MGRFHLGRSGDPGRDVSTLAGVATQGRPVEPSVGRTRGRGGRSPHLPFHRPEIRKRRTLEVSLRSSGTQVSSRGVVEKT